MNRIILKEDSVLLFHRKDMFYPLALKAGENVLEHVRLNPGTTKVENATTLEILYEDKPDDLLGTNERENQGGSLYLGAK